MSNRGHTISKWLGLNEYPIWTIYGHNKEQQELEANDGIGNKDLNGKFQRILKNSLVIASV